MSGQTCFLPRAPSNLGTPLLAPDLVLSSALKFCSLVFQKCATEGMLNWKTRPVKLLATQ